MNLPPWLVPPLYVLGFIAWWSFICCMIAFVGGWAKLARRFRAVSKPPGQTFSIQSGQFNGTRYNNCLIVVVAPQGLYLSMFPLFRSGHAPLLIPWSALSPFKAGKQLWVTLYTTTVTIGKFDKVTIAFYNQELVAAITAHLPPRETGG